MLYKKATRIDKIFTLTSYSKCQDFINFCGLLGKYELYQFCISFQTLELHNYFCHRKHVICGRTDHPLVLCKGIENYLFLSQQGLLMRSASSHFIQNGVKYFLKVIYLLVFAEIFFETFSLSNHITRGNIL